MDQDRLEGAAREIGGTLKETAGRLTGDLAAEAEGLVTKVAGVAETAYGQTKEGLRDVAGAIDDAADQAYARSARILSRGSKRLADDIGEHPLTAFVVAGAVGYLLALLIHAKR